MEDEQSRFTLEMKPNQNLTKEAFRAIVMRSWRGPVYCALACICLILAVVSFKAAADGKDLEGVSGVNSSLSRGAYFLCLGAGTIGILALLPGLNARKYIRRVQEMYGDLSKVYIIYRFDEDMIRSEGSSGEKRETPYDRIVAVQETAHGLILRRNNNVFEILDKNRLKGGSMAEFQAFLREKCPGAKFSWR